MARFLFFSDLHLSDGTAIDNFGLKKKILFSNFVNAVKKSNIDRIFVVGDIYELWQGIGDKKERLERAKKTYPEIASFLQNNCVELIGNHDQAREKLDKIASNKLIEADGIKIWLEHGDRFDRYYKKWPWLCEAAVKVFAILEHLFGKKSQNIISRWVKERLPKTTPASSRYSGNLSEYEKGAKELLVQKDCDIVVLGHTHKLYQKEWEDLKGKKRVYLNCGAWVDEHSDYIIVDTVRQNYRNNLYHNQEAL